MDIHLDDHRFFHVTRRGAHFLRLAWLLLLSLLLLLFSTASLQAQEFGESVSRRGAVSEDIYLAGATVNLSVVADGDVTAAGGTLNIGDEIRGDALLAGGSVTVRGILRDDVRAAGGTVLLDGDIGDDALLAGGNVTLTPASRVNGRAWLAGGRVDVAGVVRRELRAAGGRVVISGEVMGDAWLAGERIELQSGAVIRGNLRYMSPQAAVIDKNAKIVGTVTHLPSPKREHGIAGAAAVAFGFFISLMVTGIVLLALFPRAAAAVTGRIRRAPWVSLGLGLAVLAATPVVIILLFVTVLGLWLGLILLAAYLAALLVAYLSGVLTVGDWYLERRLRKKPVTLGRRIGAFVIALLGVTILGLVPLLGGLLLFALLLFGLGGLSWQIYRATAGKG